MDVQQLKKQRKDMLSELFADDFIDDFFRQIKDDGNNPGFAYMLAAKYFSETDKKIDTMSKILNEQTVDFEEINRIIITLKGGTGCVGFRRLHNICIAFLNCCENRNREGCIRSLQQFKEDMAFLRNKLTCVFQTEKLIVAAGGSL